MHTKPSQATQFFAHYDQRMALVFGLLMASVLVIVVSLGTWYARSLMLQDNHRMAMALLQVAGDSVGGINQFGEESARQLLKSYQEKNPALAYFRWFDGRGRLRISSYPEPLDQPAIALWGDELKPLLQRQVPYYMREARDAEGKSIREFFMRYSTASQQTGGFLQIGVYPTDRDQLLSQGLLWGSALLLVLLLFIVQINSWLGRYFAAPVRRLADQLGLERERLDNALRAMLAGTWEWDIGAQQVRLNERWAQILGYSLAELEPINERTAVLLGHPDDAHISREAADQHLAGITERFSCETRARHKDGHWVWVLDSGYVTLRDARGAPLKMVGTRLDISLRKQAEHAYHQEAERFVALAKVSNTGVWEWDGNTQYLWCSPEYFSMLGRSPEEFDLTAFDNIERAWGDLLHPDDRAQAQQTFADYLAAGCPGMYESEFRMSHANGEWVWIWSRGSALRDEQGQLTQKVMGTHINITSLKEAQTLLRESQQQLTLVSDNLPDSLVFQLDCGLNGEQRSFLYVSAGVERLHGLTAEQVREDARVLYSLMGEPELLRLQHKEAECIAQMKPFRAEFRLKKADGLEHWHMVSSVPRRLSNGHILFDGIEMDITALKRQELQIYELNTTLELRVEQRTAELSAALKQLQRTQDELLQSEKLASLGALVAGVAHELNTPIGNAVTVASTLTRRHQQFAAQVQIGLTRSALSEYLQDVDEGGQIIERNLTRAAELIGSFKQLAVDQTSYQRRSFDLLGLVQEVVLALRPALRKTPHQLNLEVPPELLLDSYPGPLGQVLMNLINNALLHAFKEGQQGQIWLKAALLEPGWLMLEVSDDGQGVEPEHLKKMFDPFFTTKLGQGGSGLGLHISYNLVSNLLGGRIELKSAAHQGCRFVLRLPLVAPLKTPEAEAAAADQGAV